MSFASQSHVAFVLRRPSAVAPPPPTRIPTTAALSPLKPGDFSHGRSSFMPTSIKCNAISTSRVEEYKYTDDHNQSGLLEHDGLISDKINELVTKIQLMLQNMDDGEISISPYDTAWVSLVEDVGGNDRPQFPTSLEWISNNQLPDGSWGDPNAFLVHDRILNTLACVVALKSWKMHPHKCNRGVSFVRENIYRMDDEKEEHMPNGFEVVFPALLQKAKTLNIDIPYEFPGIQKFYAKRDLKFARIPMDILHSVPTTLLFSLEGVRCGLDLDWGKLLELQAADGSFLYSPSSTAFALEQTKDQNCLKYLSKLVRKFDGGVPNVYPVDLFEHNWAVDRLQRLGISRYFTPEINQCLDYSYRYWSNSKGMYSASNSQIQDVDDTAMGFRLLRLNGYDVSTQGFRQFEAGGDFFCFAGQSSQAVTGMYNLYRASQVMFPGEKLLEDAKKFSTNFLQQKRANNQLTDKWVIAKDVPAEVGYALDIPWYASLPRLEARFFIQQYGGDDDVWIGKTLYRMGYVNNNTYLELAKLDYNTCQRLHQHEWITIQRWYEINLKITSVGLSKRGVLLSYYLAAANLFEPQNSTHRIAWAKTSILVSAIQLSPLQKRDFINQFHRSTANNGYETSNVLVKSVIKGVHELSMDAMLTHNKDIHRQLFNAWRKWMSVWEEGGDGEAELLLSTLNTCDGVDESTFSDPKYEHLLEITVRVTHQLHLIQNAETKRVGDREEIDLSMQQLVKLVFTKSSSDLDSCIKQRFFAIARSFYYVAHCDPEMVDSHIAKVLFERVM
uniref:Terpene synthase 1 n=1 Tax=Pogostemon cablin TaxID=28511 RepID=A0A3G6V9W3_POGCB|nr:terpene synthase 1 [Pogostemon cablin]